MELAREYGTPLYLFDEEMIESAVAAYRDAFARYYPGDALVLYASKAFCCKEIYRVMSRLGAGADVVSGGELYTALRAGFPAGKIYFHGNNKTAEELREAVAAGVGAVVVDNLPELRLLESAAAEAGVRQKILLRVKPGIDVHTHKYVRTGQIDSKFGFALETGEAREAAREALGLPHIDLAGLHAHIGSQIFETEPFADLAVKLLDFAGELKADGAAVREFNLGGGYGIRYTSDDDPPPAADFIKTICSAVTEKCRETGGEPPRLLIEPGRSIVGPAGATLYTVGSVKEIPGVRTYVSVDGGMADNPRYILYGSRYETLIANRAGEEKTALVTVAGRCCESGDLLQENAPIQEPAPGDILAVMGTGAYNYSMASNYNRLPRPAAVAVKGGEARLIIKRESYADLVENDL